MRVFADVDGDIFSREPMSDKKLKGVGVIGTGVAKRNNYENIIVPNLDIIQAWIRDGLTDVEIATKLDISPASLNRYKDHHPDFKAMFRENKERCDLVNIVGAYKRRAEGYTVVEHTRHYIFKDGERILMDEYEKERHIPADIKASEHWIQMRLKHHPIYGQLGEIIKNSYQRDIDASDSVQGGVVLMPEVITIEEPTQVFDVVEENKEFERLPNGKNKEVAPKGVV